MPANITRTYDLNNVTLVLGTSLITEFIKGEALVASFDDDDWAPVQGSHGSVVRAKKFNNLGTLVIRTMQGSPTNTLLMALRNTDVESGAGSFPLQLKDNLGGNLVSAPQCWFTKASDMTFGEEIGQNEWNLKAGHLQMTYGPNLSA